MSGVFGFCTIIFRSGLEPTGAQQLIFNGSVADSKRPSPSEGVDAWDWWQFSLLTENVSLGYMERGLGIKQLFY